MEKTNFWKDVAKYGAIIGALLAVSFMLETRLQITQSNGLPSSCCITICCTVSRAGIQ